MVFPQEYIGNGEVILYSGHLWACNTCDFRRLVADEDKETVSNTAQVCPVCDPPWKPEALPRRQEIALRDHFAGEALQVWLARQFSDKTWRAQDLAERSYEIADAMLAARNQRGGGP